MKRAKGRYDLPSDVALMGEVNPLDPKKRVRGGLPASDDVMNESVPAEYEECFRIFQRDLGAELEDKWDLKTFELGLHSPPRDVCAEYGRTPASSLVWC